MPVEPNVIQDILDEIGGAEKSINAIGNTQRAKLQDIKVNEVRQAVLGNAAKVDAAQWAQLADERQDELFDRLTKIRTSLSDITGTDGPKDAKSIMYEEYASNTTIIALALIGLGIALILIVGIQRNWKQATGTDYSLAMSNVVKGVLAVKEAVEKEKTAQLEMSNAVIKLEDARSKKDEEARKKYQAEFEKRQKELDGSNDAATKTKLVANEALVKLENSMRDGTADEGSVLYMVILLGGLGGSLHLLGSLVKYVGNRQLKRSWIMYYLSLPITGAILAPIIYMLLRVGILSPTNTSTGGSTITNLNLIAIYAFAALTGLFSKAASDKLAEVFQNLFRSESTAKDKIGVGKSSGNAATTGTGK